MISNPTTKGDAIFNVSQKHDAAKEIAARQRTVLDAKLAQLRALRLAKEEADKEAAKVNPAEPTVQKKRTRAGSL